MLSTSIARAILPLLLSAPALATDYYVNSTVGSNTNPGTTSQPWRTVSHALAQPLTSSDRLLLTGSFNAATGETFPLHLLPGVDVLAEGTALIDAGTQEAFSIDRPGIHDQSIGDGLTVRGTPVLRMCPDDTQVTLRANIESVRFLGDVIVDANIPGIPHLDSCVVIRDCFIQNDLLSVGQVISGWQYTTALTIQLQNSEVQGSLHLVAWSWLQATTNLIAGDLNVWVTAGPRFQLTDNIIVSGDLIVRAAHSTASGNGIIERNQTLNGKIDVDNRALDNTLLMVDNEARGDISGDTDTWEDFRGNTSGGNISIRGNTGFSWGITDNRAQSISIDVSFFRGGSLSGNTCTSGPLTATAPPTSVINNTVHAPAGDGIRIEFLQQCCAHGGPFVSGNTISSLASSGSGINIVGHTTDWTIENNSIEGFATGIQARSYEYGPTRFLRNLVHHCDTGILIDADQAGDIELSGNVLAQNDTGLEIRRVPAISGAVRMTNNILAFNAQADVASFPGLPNDDIRANLARDGSLAPLHATNLWGDPHFIDLSADDYHLRRTSPCLGSGIDPAGGASPYDMGLYSNVTLPLLNWSIENDELVVVTGGGFVLSWYWLWCTVFPTQNAIPGICNEWFGADPGSFLFAELRPHLLPELRYPIPPGISFVAVMQAFANIDPHGPSTLACQLTNVIFPGR